MGKNRSASGLTNVIQYDNNGNIAFVSGSTTLMQVSSSGAITTTGVISGSNALSASFSLNSALLNDTGSVGFATTGSLLTVSSSQQQISASLLQVSASYISLSGSYNTFSGSASTRITENSSSIQQVSSSQQEISSSLLNVISIFATTGSNSFRATQSITGSLTVTGQIIAQTLNVQQVTSSIIYSSGSNNFGCDINSRQVFTGSFYQTGSIAVFNSCVGIGTSSPTRLLDVSNTSGDSTIVITSADATGQSSLFYGKPSDANIGGVLYNHCNNQMSFRVNDTTKMSIASTGDVGIGTCTPSSISTFTTLEIRGATGGGIKIGKTGCSQFNIQHDGTDAYFNNTTNGALYIYTSDADRFRITSTGIACFACQVCAPSFKGGTIYGTAGYFSCHIELNDNGSGWIYGVDKNHSIILRGDRTGCVADFTNYYQYGGNLSTGKGHNFWTDGVLASQTIKMQIANNGICMTVPLYVCNSTNSRSFQTIAGGAIIGPFGTCTLLYLSTALAGTYIINASFGAQGLEIYGGMLIVVANGGSFRTITNGSGTRSNITLSGCAVQLTNALGVTLEANGQALFIGGL